MIQSWLQILVVVVIVTLIFGCIVSRIKNALGINVVQYQTLWKTDPDDYGHINPVPSNQHCEFICMEARAAPISTPQTLRSPL